MTGCGTETLVATSLGEGARLEQAHGGRAKVEHGNNSPARFSQVLGEQVAIAETKTDANKESSEDFKVAIKNTEAVSDDSKPASEGLIAQTLAGAAAPKTMPMPTAAKKAASHEDTQSHIAKGEQDLSPPFSALVEGQDRVTKEGSCENNLTAQTSGDEVSHKVESKSAAWRAPLEQEATTAKVSLSSQNQPAQTVARKLQQIIGADIADTSPVESSKSDTDASPSEQKTAVIFPSQVSDTAEQSSQATAHVAPKSSTQNATAYLSANSHRSSPPLEAGVPQRAQSSLGRIEISSQQHSALSTQEPSVDASDESQLDSAPQLKQLDHNTLAPQSASKIQESSTPRQVPSHRVSPTSATPIKTSAVSASAQEPKSDAIKNSSDQAQSSEASTSDSGLDETIRTDVSQTSAAMAAALYASNQSLAPSLVQGQVPAKASSSAHESPETSPIHHNAPKVPANAFVPAPISSRGSTTARVNNASSALESNAISIQAQNTSNVPISKATVVSSSSQEAHVTARVASATQKAALTAHTSNITQHTESAASSSVDQALKADDLSDGATATAETHSDKASSTVKILSDKAPVAAGSVDQPPPATVKIITNETSAVLDEAPIAANFVTDEATVSAAIVSEEARPAAQHAVSADTHTTLRVESTTQSLPLTDKDKSSAPLAAHAQLGKGAALPVAHEQATQVQAITSDAVTPSDTPTSLITPSLSQEPRRTKSKNPPKVTLSTAPMPVATKAPTTERVAVQGSGGGKADTVKTSSKIGSEQAKAPLTTAPTAISSEAALAASEQPAASSPIQVRKTPVAASTHTAIKSTAQSTSDPGKSPDAEEDDDRKTPLVLHTASPTTPSPDPISPPSASSLSTPKADASHSMQIQNDTAAPLPSKDVQPAADPTHATKTDLPSPIAAPNVPTTVLPAQATMILAKNEAAPIETSKPSAIAAEKNGIIDRAVEDPGLSVNVMPHSAHLSIASNTGDLALHVRIRDGNADVNVSGAMAPLFDSKAPEVRSVLAGQGLSLGSYATDQQGGYQGQQGQPDNPPRTSDVLPLPTPRRTTSSTPEVQIADERRIHVTA